MARPRLSAQSANTRVSDSLTSRIIEAVRNLPPCRKYDYLKETFLSKFVSDDTDPADLRRSRAIEKWLWVESVNESTEDRLLTTPGDYQIMPRVRLDTFVSWVQDFIADMIGDTPPETVLLGQFSGGASTSRPRTASFPACKYTGEAHVTPDAYAWFPLLRELAPGWLESGGPSLLKAFPGNVMFTVPKKTDIDRVAAKETDICMFMQKGVGNYFRNCLRRRGINLNDQSINNRLAREGSIHGNLATLDLSNASDSVTRELVFQFLPITWFTLLDSIRSKVTLIDGHEHRNVMFSSMGNGFTFELESLLFFSIAKAVSYFGGHRGVVSVYGDDIIVPTGAYSQLSHVLWFFGFEVNPSKSFDTGSFRESCGGHYYAGFDITPFYLRAPIKTVSDVIHIMNQIRLWSYVEGIGCLDPALEPLWLELGSHVPKNLWGGDSPTRYQVMSRDVPSRKLVPDSRRKSTGVGGYYHWLNATWERAHIGHEGVVTSKVTLVEATASNGNMRSRPVRSRTVPILPAWFSSELG
uniref:RNA-directed RNA polymerase n=1 Tax=Erysiphales associated levi-like virus 1 TaxID=2754851 RepID=A0A7D6EVS1_9VIRU|nr:putative RdRp [Erysiphales associated levi-like virus 1]